MKLGVRLIDAWFYSTKELEWMSRGRGAVRRTIQFTKDLFSKLIERMYLREYVFHRDGRHPGIFRFILGL